MTLLLTYSGVAALFSGLGATAAVNLNLKTAGQAGSASGAAGLAILLCWAIGRDPPIPPAKITTTYYINFPDLVLTPADLTANIEIDQVGKPKKIQPADVVRAPGGNAFEIIVRDVAVNERLIIRINSSKGKKSWSSASILPTEGFMILNEDPQ